ncbi:MAG TPA: hypothetical protein VGQ19_04675 [Burkholderiales bacterium]|jgi:hypothetical protein|nr:hypothetical protein [Burkholderiales bacterium]
MAKAIRIGILLFVLATVAVGAWQTRSRTQSWQRTLDVVVYPVNGDRRETTAAYIVSLSNESFASIRGFMRREAERYKMDLVTPVDVSLGPHVSTLPPAPPVGGSTAGIILWSLKLRFWAWRNDEYPGSRPDIRIFAVFYDPATTRQVEHSIGLKEGLIGVANVFAVNHMTEENNVIVVHELLHTLGATDKYDRSTTQPLFPVGFADPEQSPLYPQKFAEIMAGRVPLSETESDTPRNLELAIIGPMTAAEISWRR